MNYDVVSLLYSIRSDIKLLNESDKEKKLKYIKKNFLQMMELLKLFLISERNMYYGYFLTNMKFEVNFETKIIAGIKLNSFPPIFESNPLILCEFKLKEIIYIICHEIDHIVFNHPSEMIKVNPHRDDDLFYKFNLAADAAVNDRLNLEISNKNNFMSAPKGIITSKSLREMFELDNIKPLESYLYYFNIIKNLNLKRNISPKDLMINKLDGYKNDLNNFNENNVGDKDGKSSSIEDHNWNDGDSTFDMEYLVKEFLNSTFSMIGNESRGLMPGYFLSEIEKINIPPKISWERILKKYVGTIVAGKKKTRTRLNRRQPERFDLSGQIDNKVIKIVVAIDTSGSISDNQVLNIFNEIFSIISKRKKEITIIECDSKVQRVYKIINKSDVKQKICGRGGTSFTPVIEFINNNKYFRDALLIYFTDGYGEKKIPKPNTYRNIWVLTESDKLSVINPYGIVLKMD